jgi:uncharacterized membrane protein HdeD (DUF308 family)
MKTLKSTKTVILIVGMLAILAGIYFLFIGKEFNDYWLPFLSGVALIGSLFFQKDKPKVTN